MNKQNKKKIFSVILIIAISLFCVFNESFLISIFKSDKEQERILVIGTARSGTSAIYQSIKDALDKDSEGFFEPQSFAQVNRSRAKQVLAKMVFFDAHRHRYIKNFNKNIKKFDKKILIVRDPRDILVSNLLYWHSKMCYTRNDEKREKFINALRQKEKDPKSISFFELYNLRDSLEMPEIPMFFNVVNNLFQVLNDYNLVIRMAEEKDILIIRYEDYIDGKTTDLNNYLQLSKDIKNNPKVENATKTFARSKKYGNWKNWFTEKDLKLFKEIYAKQHKEFLTKFGYYNDWKLNENPVIDPKYSSEYVAKRIEESKENKLICRNN